MKTLLWIMPPKALRNSGVYKYSENIYSNLKTVYVVHLPSGKSRYVAQFIAFPILLLFAPFFFRKMIISEEGLGFLSLFFWKKVITIVHDVRPAIIHQTKKEFYKTLYLKLSMFICSRCSDFITVSKTTKSELLKQYGLRTRNVIVVENIIDFHSITEPAKNYSLLQFVTNARSKENPIILLYVGSDETRKNTISLAHALITILSSHKNMFFIRLGRPIHQENFDEFVNIMKPFTQLNRALIEQEVHESDLTFAFSNSSVFIMPSTFEGFGRTPIEAQWFGLPVISTLSSALKETMQKSCIEIHPPYKELQIVTAIEKYLLSDWGSLSIQSRENAARFSKDKIMQKVFKVLD